MMIATTACGTADREALSSSRSPAGQDQKLRLLREHSEQHNSGIIALVEADGRVWRGAAGFDAHDHPVDPVARFDMGSTAKTFEATVALQLVEEGRLSLDDSVEKWIPDRVEGARLVLIRHLLNHTSGLAGSHAPFHPVTTPGTMHSYSNLGYGLLGEIISEVTGRPLGREIRDRILEPLGLDETWTSPEGSSLPWLGAPYGDCRICVPPEARGGPVSTTSDLARFFQALLRGDLLGDDMLAEMKEAVPIGTEMSAGLGLFRFDLPCGTAYGHGGDLTYYTNQVLVSGDGSKTVVVARNLRDWFSIKIFAEELYCAAV